MKRIHIISVLLLLLVLLGGCSRREELSEVSFGETTAKGSYTGEEADGLPHGEGSFLSEEGWSFTGTFLEGAIAGGEAKNLPYPLFIGEQRFDGSYSGSIAAGLPEGEGVWTGEAGSFEGSFAAGSFIRGEAENLPLLCSIGEESLSGSYSGSIAAGLAEGEGRFVIDGAGRQLCYEGGFAAGEASSEGSLSDSACLIQGDRGFYEGSTLNGLPEGHGSFRSRSSEDVDYCYTGQWSGGLFHGQGELIYDSELYYERRGSFTAGEFTPDAYELLEAIGSREPRFTLSQSQKDYIDQYPDLLDFDHVLEDYRRTEYRFLWSSRITWQTYVSDPVKYQDIWLLLYNYVILDSWVNESFGEDCAVTHILATNTVYTCPVECIIFGQTEGLDAANYFSAYGIPLGVSCYTNENGEETDCVVMLIGALGSY